MKNFVLELDRPRKLRFGFGAARAIREKFGARKIDDFLDMHIDEIPTMVWAGLLWEDPNLTVEQVEKMLEEKVPEKYRILDIINIVTAALTENLGVGGETQKKTASTSEKSEGSPSPSGSPTSNLKT